MDFLNNILSFITDSNKRLSVKTVVVILTLLSVFLVDNVTGFSFYHSNQRKLDQLESIQNLLKDTTLTTDVRHKLSLMQSRVFERENVFEYLLSFFKNKYFRSSGNEQAIIEGEGDNARNDFLFLLSTSGFYMLFAFLLIIIIFFTGKDTSFWVSLFSVILLSIIMFLIIFSMYWLLGKIIPDELFGSWTWNYIVNLFVQIVSLIGIYFLTKTNNK
ncbi:hypothetical protein CBG53_03795 [Porphyromonas gingivalis]|uniref:hypothetical protein n=1 Tax=Porphyromonas gingivalis TaxID=837 RepID=UPI000B4C6D1A|nr:hypothetical protein [Porphyromonas gingivalis]OWP32585.1 hypothetical protein CBG53_03795 [Porphyromonas gingivalis]